MKVKKVIVDKLPIDCNECKLTIGDECKECIFLFAQYDIGRRPDDCPLVEEELPVCNRVRACINEEHIPCPINVYCPI